LEEGHCLRSQALDVCNIIGITEYPDFRATSLETLRHMIIANVGITLIPQIAAKKDDGMFISLLPAIRLLAVLGWYLELPVLESRVLTVLEISFLRSYRPN